MTVPTPELSVMRPNLQTLELLARERSSDKRRALLRSVTDCFFLAADQHSVTELQLFDEVIQMVLTEVEPVVRAELSARLADLARPPPTTLRMLARDELAVAEPILKRSAALTDNDLEEIARHHSQGHLAAIADRGSLSERVTDVLVDRGDEQVLGRVVANQGARFSERGFTILADRAESDETLRGRLAARLDLPDDVAARIVPLISKVVQAKLGSVGVALHPSAHDELVEESGILLMRRLTSATGTARPLEELLDLLAQGAMQLDEVVAELADGEAAMAVARLVSERVQLRADTVARALYSDAEEPIAVLCRAAGLHLDGYSAVMRMRRRRRRHDAQANPAELLSLYLQIAVVTAERVVRFLKVRESANRPS